MNDAPPTVKAWGVISPRSERYPKWIQGFGSDAVPLKSHQPERVNLDGLGSSLAYMVDLAVLSAADQARVYAQMADEWGVTPKEVRDYCLAFGLPVLWDDVCPCVEPQLGREFWAADAPPDRTDREGSA